MNHRLPEPLQALISHLKKIPGVGTRTAERFAFELLGWSQEALSTLSTLLSHLKEELPPCTTCGCLTDRGVCRFCESPTRDAQLLCLIASPREAFSFEEAGGYRGLYHVVEHLLSPLDGRNTIDVSKIRERIERNHTQEVILAFDSTLEGDTTALYLKEALQSLPLKITRLAFGLPVGSSLEYIDGGTLARALMGRSAL